MCNEGYVGGKKGESMEEERIDFVDLSHARQFASALALHSLNRKGANAYTPWSRITNPRSTESCPFGAQAESSEVSEENSYASHRGHRDTEFFRTQRRAGARGEDTESRLRRKETQRGRARWKPLF